MEPKPTSLLQLQHPSCEGCLWHNGAQTALNSVTKNNVVLEARITCQPRNTNHALVNAYAITDDKGDPDAQNHFVLVGHAVLFCQRRKLHPHFVPIPDDIA